MKHPFQAISLDRIRKVLIPLTLLTFLLMITLNWISTPLNNPSVPNGIISFELAGNVETARTILASWDSKAQLIASLSLGLDYLFLAVYSTAIGMGCIWSMTAFTPQKSLLMKIGVLLAWGQWFAAFTDGLENAALIKILLGDLQAPWPQAARIFAMIKFSLIALGLLYIMIGSLIRIIHRTRPRP